MQDAMLDIELEVLIRQTKNKAAGSFSPCGYSQQDLIFLVYLLYSFTCENEVLPKAGQNL